MTTATSMQTMKISLPDLQRSGQDESDMQRQGQEHRDESTMNTRSEDVNARSAQCLQRQGQDLLEINEDQGTISARPVELSRDETDSSSLGVVWAVAG